MAEPFRPTRPSGPGRINRRYAPHRGSTRRRSERRAGSRGEYGTGRPLTYELHPYQRVGPGRFLRYYRLRRAYRGAYQRGYHQVRRYDRAITPRLFSERVANGLYGEPANISAADFILYYRLGEMREGNNVYDPHLLRALERFIAENRESRQIADYLGQGRNLHQLMRTLEFETQKIEARAGHEKSVQLLDAQFRLIFGVNGSIQILVDGIKSIADKVLSRKKAEVKEEERLAEKRAEKLLALKRLVEAGKIIEAVLEAIKTRNIETILELIRQDSTDTIRIIERVCRSQPEESLELIINAAVAAVADKKQVNISQIITLARRIAGKIARSSPEKYINLLAQITTELKAAYHASFTKGADAPAQKARSEILIKVLQKLPEALTEILKEHSRHYSWVRRAINRLLNYFEFKIKDYATDVLEPVIKGIAQTTEGQDIILNQIFDGISTPTPAKQNRFRQLWSLKIASGQLGKKMFSILVKKILANVSTPPAFAAKSRTEEMRELVAEIAKGNNLTAITAIGPKKARAILFFAAKIQHLMENLRGEGNRDHAEILHSQLDRLDGADSVGFIKIPEFDRITHALNPNSTPTGIPIEVADQLIGNEALRATNFNVYSARRVIDTLRRNEQVWKQIPSPISEAQKLSSGEPHKLARVIHFLRYAYSFLTMKTFKASAERDLAASLALDHDEKQLFLTLQDIPQVLQRDVYSNLPQQMRNGGNPRLALEIQVFQMLIEQFPKMADKLEWRDLARNIVNRVVAAIDEYGAKGVWKNIIQMAQNGSQGAVSAFFVDLVEDLKREMRITDHDSIQLAIKSVAERHPEIIPPRAGLPA